MAGYEYVSPEQLAGFDKYKYSALDTNPLSLYVMHPFWNTVVKVFPTWLAPNLITFSGFLLVVFNFLLMAYFDPDFYASAPGHKHVPDWVWIVVGILNFTAYTLDGVDGKQARRTNSSTPLGELFDHGLDSWSCVYFVVTVYSIFGRGSSGVSVFVLYLLLWVVLFSFILSHWEKYNTGILFLPWGYDISQVTISFVYIVTAIVGVEAWYEPFLFNFLYRDLFTAMIIGCALCVTLPMSLLNFFRSYKNNTLKHNSVYEAMVPFFSPCLLFILSTAWILQSPSDILELHPRVFYFMVGTAFANITCQLIVCQMSSTRCPTFNWLLVPLFLVVLVVNLGVASYIESILLYTLTTAFTLAHIHYGVRVVSNLQQYWFPLLLINSEMKVRENFKRSLLIIVAGRIWGYSLNIG
ncbi:ethanolaminephosphotransferase 1 isoform X1 [Camelus ferus]|uniref:Ethanolaminephosphotransferase 1 n=2 Tax=Camelus TaxID=9836 RepID=A0A8B7KD87_CAMFR|nr:ethanolaminephosphotransferase 1 isoform X1 [Camelus bactrianus]XP_014418999.1 ethanolaminephosphotransferase 1 isoform X1 [Camelus ferus]